MDRQKVICVVGPTASGKTRLAVELALQFGGEVVSADSMQVYRGMDIGTAKPTASEMQGIPHHLIGFLDPGEPYSVADYVNDAGAVIAQILSKGRIPVLAGGTGLYLDTLVQGIDLAEIEADPDMRRKLEEEARQEGGEAMLEKIRAFDPQTAAALNPRDMGRIVRAAEVFYLTGIPISEHQRRSRLKGPRYDALWIGLGFSERQALYDRINRRVDQMIDMGLLDEVKQLMAQGLGKTSHQAIGYKEFRSYLDGEQTLEQAAEHLKMQTRRYAKRQLTWFRKNQQIHWLDVDSAGTPDELVKQAAGLVGDFLRQEENTGR